MSRIVWGDDSGVRGYVEFNPEPIEREGWISAEFMGASAIPVFITILTERFRVTGWDKDNARFTVVRA